jgi:hypothetical protein
MEPEEAVAVGRNKFPRSLPGAPSPPPLPSLPRLDTAAGRSWRGTGEVAELLASLGLAVIRNVKEEWGGVLEAGAHYQLRLLWRPRPGRVPPHRARSLQ